MYGCCQVFMIDDMDVFFRELEPLAKVTLTMFQVDRPMQLIVHFRPERLVHHGLTSTWTLLVMEWSYSMRDPGVFVTGAIMEGLAKFSWYPHFIARMNRAFIRNQPNGEWNAESIVGADVLFIGKTSRRQTLFMRFGYSTFLFSHLVAPFAMVGVYLGIMGESVSLGWKIALPLIFVLFNLLDATQYKSFSRQSKYSYWAETVVQRNHEKETNKGVLQDSDYLPSSTLTEDESKRTISFKSINVCGEVN